MSAVGVVFGLGISGVALALMLAKRATKSKSLPKGEPDSSGGSSREPITTPLWTPETPKDLEVVLVAACRCVAKTPELSDGLLLECIWRNHWRGVPFPAEPVAGDHASVEEALEVARRVLAAARSGKCDDDLPGVDPAPIPRPLDPEPKPEPKPDEGEFIEPEPVDMGALSRQDPTPGFFYQVRKDDQFMGDHGIVAQALYRAVLIAAQTKGWSPTKAQSRAAALSADAKARVAYFNIIQCSPWNDALYGTWGYGKHAMPAPHGRAIRLVAKHDRVYDRLADGQTPIRTLDFGAPADKGTGSATGAGDSYELLWLPPLRADALLDVNRQRQVVADGLVWPGGLSKYNPPLAVQALGILHAPPGPWGCEGVAA